jgi:hypothetical protein
MKLNSFFFVFCIVLLTIVNYAQIPNPGFEDWDANGNPVNWQVNNAPPSYTTVLKTSDAHSGSWAAEGDVVTYSIFTMAPSLFSGTASEGFPINFRPASLRGYYKFTSVTDDFLQVQIHFRKNSLYIGGGAVNLTPAGSYTEFNVDAAYITEEVPDTAFIGIFIANLSGFSHVGSKLFIDDLSWSNTTDVTNSGNGIPNEFALIQNYPNPFNPSTTIQFQIPNTSFVNLKVYDILGNEVATLVNEEKPVGVYEAEFNAAELSSGLYFYTLQAGSFIETKKMILLR